VLGAIAAGALLACAVAVGLSPLAPLGSIRAVYPYPGVAFDWTVLGAGFALFTCLLAATAVVIAYQQAPHRALARAVPSRATGSPVVRAAWAAGLPAPAAEGVRLALDPRAECGRVPVRSAILGAVLATVVLLATVTFGASLSTLVSHPALYGWNWTYALSSGEITVHNAAAVLDRDPEVAAWTNGWFGTAQVDGVTVPVLGTNTNAAIAPPLLSGHGLQGQGQVVLGAMTLAQLHKRVGDVVTVADGGPRPFRLRIVGTATLPSFGVSGTQHTEMGTGAVLPYQDIPGAAGNEPNTVLVPLGIALGRALWDLFAGQISVVPQPTVPALTVVLIVAGALVTANLVALLPGWVAGRTPAAALLRAE
jgi:hypothetical protein